MNFTILIISLITILGLVLRILGIDKDGGLWNDEYVSWSIAVIPIGKEFFRGILAQCHMPLYCFYLKFFNLISSNDTFLRYTSVLPGIISIPVMYLAGKEKSKFCGYMCALFTALSSLLVYYSQEVRFYSLLFLFSALSVYFTLRTVKKPRKRNLSGLLISDFLIIITHTIGFVYVFFNLVYVTFKLRKFYKKFVKVSWIITAIILVISSPLLIKILFFGDNMSQWWAVFNFNKILQMFCDYFTPVISNVDVIENIHGLNFKSIFLIVPALIAFAVLVIGIFDKTLKEINQLWIIVLGTFLTAVIAAMLGKLAITSKYLMEIYPILILIFCSTISAFNKNWFKISIFTIFFFFQLGFVFSHSYAAFQPREEGNKYVADLIKSADLKDDDFIVLTYYPARRFYKYVDFSKLNVVEIYKGNFNYYYMPFLSTKDAMRLGKNLYRGTFLNSTLPLDKFSGSTLTEKLNEEVYYKMKPNQKVAFLFLDSVSFIDEATFQAVISNYETYKRAPLPFLVFSNIRNEIIKTMPVKARNIRFEAKGAWTMVSFQY